MSVFSLRRSIIKGSSRMDPSYLTFTAKQANSTIRLVREGSDSGLSTPVLEYSTDNGLTWNQYSINTTLTLQNIDDSIIFRGRNRSFAIDNSNFHRFVMTGVIAASGDVTSLLNNLGGSVTLHNYAFLGLFKNCTSLTEAPNLPSKTLAQYCYYEMFHGCTALTKAPDIPATRMASSCCYSMFENCSNLIQPPLLPATILDDYCYLYMFGSCTSLRTAPKLPAVTMKKYCYSAMFYGCTSLETAPDLPAKDLVLNCYNSMFAGCTSLNYINCMAVDMSATKCLYNWVLNVAQTGTFVKSVKATWSTGDSGIPTGWTEDVTSNGPLLFKALANNSTISLTKVGSPAAVSFEYRINNGNWNNYSIGSTISLSSTSDYVEIRTSNNSNHSLGSSGSNYHLFVMTGQIAAYGNTTSLIYSNSELYSSVAEEYCFKFLFKDCSALYTAPLLPSIEVRDSSYHHMFENCIHLVTAPELQATGALYPECYALMFKNCISLVYGPSAINATTADVFCCESMFEGCTSLTHAPALNVALLEYGCYSTMFEGCTSLTTAPDLLCENLASWCYNRMFYGCSSLNYIKALFINYPSAGYTQNWVYGVAQSGTFVMNNDAQWLVFGANAIPEEWTVQNATS